MGLELKLFEDLVDPSLICTICRKVAVDPVSNSCQHIFCRACVSKCLKYQRSSYCPECASQLRGESSEVSLEIKLKLLGLRIKCSHGCGTDCHLADLPDHVADDCPNAPVPCPNKDTGCKKTVKRHEVALHEEECYYRMVNCEACDFRIQYCELFTHQSKTRCLEKKLRQQVARATKSTNMEVRRHRDYVARQQFQLERHQRQATLTYVRSKQKRYINGKKSRKEGNTNVEGGDVFSETGESNVDSTGGDSTVALTSSAGSIGSYPAVTTCKNCRKPFREANNHSKACSYHQGVCIQ